MGNMHLVTGHAGKEHVKASDHGAMFAALFGSGQYILDLGNKLAAQIVSNNLVRISDGELLMQGRHARIPKKEYVDIPISANANGYLRNDLIVVRYTKNAETSVEDTNIIAITGNSVTADPKDPEYVAGDILTDGALQNDVPLYRVRLNGTEITGIDSLLTEKLPSFHGLAKELSEKLPELEDALESLNNTLTCKTGTYTGTGTKGSGNPTKYVLGFSRPILIYIKGTTMSVPTIKNHPLFDLTSSYTSGSSLARPTAKYANGTLSWYDGSDAADQYNSSGVTYEWLALGV